MCIAINWFNWVKKKNPIKENTTGKTTTTTLEKLCENERGEDLAGYTVKDVAAEERNGWMERNLFGGMVSTTENPRKEKVEKVQTINSLLFIHLV